jgi:hypothetical protein
MARFDESIEPMTLGNMWANGSAVPTINVKLCEPSIPLLRQQRA